MKLPYASSAAALAILQKSESFAFQANNHALHRHTWNPSNINNPTEIDKLPSALFAKNDPESEDFNEYLGDDKSSEAGMAFLDIISDDMDALMERLGNGLNPDVRFFQGNTILHLIALKGSEKSLDEPKYQAAVKKLRMAGADFSAKNNMGFSALEYAEHNKSIEFSEAIKRAQKSEIKVSVKREIIDEQMATFSLQKNPTSYGRQLIVALVKMGVNPDYLASNGKTILDNINQNWSPETAAAFGKLVVAAKFKSACNGLEKAPDKTYVNDQWINALMDFYKSDRSRS